MEIKRWYVYVLVILSMLFWGMSFVWTKICLDYYQPVTLLFLRLIFSSAILFLGLFVAGKIQKIKKPDIKLFLISSLFNPFIYFLGENYGVKYSSPTISAVIIATIPVFTPIVAYKFLNEKVTRLNIAGLILSFAGVVVMLAGKLESAETSISGVFFLLLAVISAIGYSVFLKRLSKRYSAFMIIATQNLIGTLYFLPFFLIFELDSFMNTPPDSRLISSLVQLILFASTLAFVFFTISTRELGVNRTNVFTNLIPVITAVFSYFVINEYFGVNKIAGIVIVTSGVLLSQLSRKYSIVNIYRFFWPNKNK